MTNTENDQKCISDESLDDQIDRSLQFHIEEFKALREEIKIHMEYNGRMEQICVVGIGAIYVWLITYKIDASSPSDIVSLLPVAWFIPFIIAVLAFTRN